jgi:Mechanosensitive ion channel, conserved TM helix
MVEQMRAVWESLEVFWRQIGASLPRAFAALVLLVGGWLVARLARKLTIRLLRLARVDVLAERAGIEDFLVQGGVKFTTVTIIANVVYWFILLTLILAVFNSLGLHAAAELFNRLVLYVPNVIAAVVILIFGSLFARFVQSALLTYLSNVGVAGAEGMSNVARFAIFIFVVSIALEQLSIGGQILVSAFQIAFGAFCLALALAFGLGGREWAARVLENLEKKSR